MTTTTNNELIAARVDRVFTACKGSRSKDRVHVRGYSNETGFSRPRLVVYRGVIGELLLQLPECFMREGGSLSEARFRKDGVMWAKGHIAQADRLMMLGDALSYIEFTIRPMKRPVGARGSRKPEFLVLADRIKTDLGTAS